MTKVKTVTMKKKKKKNHGGIIQRSLYDTTMVFFFLFIVTVLTFFFYGFFFFLELCFIVNFFVFPEFHEHERDDRRKDRLDGNKMGTEYLNWFLSTRHDKRG